MKKKYLFFAIACMVCACDKPYHRTIKGPLRFLVLYKDLTTTGNNEHQMVLFENYPIEPLDSAKSMQIIQAYLDTTELRGALTTIDFLLDDKDWDPGEPDANWYEVNKSKIVRIKIEETKLTSFEFYDSKGYRCYTGPCWRPCR
jgi:hypothetical protein